MADIPDFDWSAIYYWERLQALEAFARRDLPEHTERSPRDPINAFKRWAALVGHQGGVQLDHAAREQLWATARLRRSMVPWGRLLGRPLAAPVPAAGFVLADLSRAVTGAETVWRAGSLATSPQASGSPIVYELTGAGVVVESTGDLLMKEADGGTFSDLAFPWASFGGSAADQNDAIYFGHAGAMFNALAFSGYSSSASHLWRLSWEYQDPDRQAAPDLVTDNGGTITLRVDTLLVGSPASMQRMDGAEVVVECLSTGVAETCTVQAYGSDGSGNTIRTTSALGQAIVSTEPGNYRASAPWVALPGARDTTLGEETDIPTAVSGGLSQAGVVSWTIPDDDPASPGRFWATTTVDGVEAFWVRARVVGTTGTFTTAPQVAAGGADASSTWTVRAAFVQGQTQDERIGVGDGSPSQAFTVAREPVLELLSVSVGGEAWSEERSFLLAGGSDRVFTWREEPDGSHTIRFGDGSRGAIPAEGQEIRAVYRHGGGVSGNVGRHEVTKDRSGNAALRNVRNGAPFTGWEELEGASAEGLEVLRERQAQHLASQGRVLAPADYESAAAAFVTAAGVALVSRAVAVEEGAGLKTVEIVVVGQGGRVPSREDLDELQEHFNGAQEGLARRGQKAPANTRVVATAYTPEVVDLVLDMEVRRGFGATAKASAEAVLAAMLQADARRLELQADGTFAESATEYQWVLGGEVRLEQLKARAAQAVRGFVDQAVTSPAADVVLPPRGLPVAGSIAVNVTEVDG